MGGPLWKKAVRPDWPFAKHNKRMIALCTMLLRPSLHLRTENTQPLSIQVGVRRKKNAQNP